MNTLIEERKQVLSKIAELQKQIKQGSSKAAISCGLRKRELEQIEVRLRKSGVNIERLDQEETEKNATPSAK